MGLFQIYDSVFFTLNNFRPARVKNQRNKYFKIVATLYTVSDCVNELGWIDEWLNKIEFLLCTNFICVTNLQEASQYEAMLRLVAAHRANLLEPTRKHVAQSLHAAGDMRAAENYYIQAGK